MIVNKSMYPIQTGFSVISQMQQRMATLQMQLGTGQKSPNLAGMGRDLPMSLSVRSRLDKIEGYSASIDMVNLRLSFLDKTMTRFDKIEGEARNSVTPGDYGTNDINMATLPGLSLARFDEIVTMLNQDVAGRYLFGGNVTDKPPLPTSTVLLEGEGGRIGFRGLLAERQAADQGLDGMGRLVLDPVVAGTGTVTLAEDGQHPFGFKLSTISTNGAPAIVAPPVQHPAPGNANLAVTFTGEPTPGQTVTLGFTLPDGTETQITLTATADANPGSGSFTIGADADATAENFRTALEASLLHRGAGELKGASTFAAADNFFAEDGIPKRPAGGSPATGLVNGDANQMVFWYNGQISTDPRASVTAGVDESTQARYGLQATESGLRRMVMTQAAMALTTYPSEQQSGSPEAYAQSRDLFDAMASRQQAQMSESHNAEAGSVERITMDLAIARLATNSASERHTNYSNQLENLLSDVETISQEDTAMAILALQTRLQASYQVTAMVSKLSLANYI